MGSAQESVRTATNVAAARLFRTSEVARILGTSPSRVRRQVHAGLCHPSRKGLAFRFTFQDLVLLRTARGLLAAGVAARRVHRTLAAVTRRIGDKPMSGLRFHAVGSRIVVQDGATAWTPDDGQLLFAFELADLARAAGVGSSARPTHLPRRTPRELRRRAGDWFDRGVALEQAGDAEAATDAYRKALALEEGHADAATNLGRLLHTEGRLNEAAKLYRRALATDPADAVAHYNLALVLEDLGRPKAAVQHYRKAVNAAPDFADAHYNLARLFEGLGRHVDAVRHFLMYSTLTEG
jgi:tetratricopeptide (TPR) repeat protein